MKPPTIPHRFDLASEFSRVIRETLSEEQLNECRRRNHLQMDRSICHTHDFCDANMAMAEAWENLSSVPCGADCPDGVNAAWSAAWDFAKRHNFSL